MIDVADCIMLHSALRAQSHKFEKNEKKKEKKLKRKSQRELATNGELTCRGRNETKIQPHQRMQNTISWLF